MGQTIGKAPLLAITQHFVNLPSRRIYDLWESFNDIAEGFGLTYDEMGEMIRVVLKDFLGYTEKKLDGLSRTLFKTFDDDKNDLVDALEFLSALAVVSGMSRVEMMHFVFGIYDFDESGRLTVDEMILALRSTTSGVCKLAGIDMPPEPEIERVAVGAFENAKSIDGSTITKHDFARYCGSTPEIASWMHYFSSSKPDDDQRVPFDNAGDPRSADIIVTSHLSDVPYRDDRHLAFMDDDSGGFRCRIDAIQRRRKPPMTVEKKKKKKKSSEEEKDDPQQEAVAEPLPPWRNIVAFLEEKKQPDNENNGNPPTRCLALEWVHGINARRRQNVWYTARGELAYSIGTLGIVMDVANRRQRYLSAHTDIIECLQVYHEHGSSETYIATGQAGRHPKIIVWDATHMEILATMRGLHTVAVLHLDFSGDGARLLTVGAPSLDAVDRPATQFIAVYDWRSAATLFTATVAAADLILDAKFISATSFVTCGENPIHFWAADDDNQDDEEKARSSRSSVNYRGDVGLLCHRVEAKQAMLCVAAAVGKVVTGTATGHLLQWEGRTCMESRKVHAGAVTALAVATTDAAAALCSASSDGKIQLWTLPQCEPGLVFDVVSLGASNPRITALSWDPLRRKIAVATAGAEVFEISASEGHSIYETGPVIRGHSERRLSALAAHPVNPSHYATVGDDKRVFLWDALERKAVQSVEIDTMARCCAFSRDGGMLAIGLGGVDPKTGARERKDGAFCVLNEKFEVIYEARDSKMPISAIVFSPDGQLLVCGSEDRSLYLYNVDANDFIATAKCRGHKGRVMHVDWSDDSKYLRSTDDHGDLLFWDADSGEQRPPRLMKDVVWDAQSAVFGTEVLAAWDHPGDKNGILKCSQKEQDALVRPPKLVAAAKSQRQTASSLLATLDDVGKLKLWSYPAKEKAMFRTGSAHGAPGGSCTFSSDDALLISTGRGDGAVAQWRIVDPTLVDNEGLRKFVEAAKPSKDKPIAAEEADYVRGPKLDRLRILDANTSDDATPTFMMEERGDDVDYAPTRPWQRTIVAPSRPPPENFTVPPDTLELEWVHGVRCHDVRGQCCYAIKSGEILYPAASLVVCMNVHDRSQRYFRDHRGEVLSLKVDDDCLVAASGELRDDPSIFVWDPTSLETFRSFKGYHRRAVLELAFSGGGGGKYLASLGGDDLHTAIVFGLTRGTTVICRVPTSQSRPLALLFARQGNGFGGGGLGFVIAGSDSIQFWDFQGGRTVTTEACRIGQKGRLQPYLCLAWVGTALVAGALDGSLYRFAGKSLDRTIAAHRGAIHCCHATNEGLATGGRDGFVRLWTSSFELRLEIDVHGLGALDPTVRSVSWDDERQRCALVTLSSEIWEVDTSDGTSCHRTGAVVNGHGPGGVHGVAAHPTLPQVATTGDDKMLRIWSFVEKRQVRTSKLEMSSRACCYSPDGKHLAVGYGAPASSSSGGKKAAALAAAAKQFDGKFVVLDCDDFAVIHEARDTQKWISEIKYSPSGDLIAVGSTDNRIYVYVNDAGAIKLQNMITQHNAGITHLDFSVTNATMQFLRSNCGAYELCFFEADTGMYIPAASRLKDTKWATVTCPLSWPAQGAWSAQNDGLDVGTVDCAVQSPVLAAGDNFGRIRLFRYPCTSSRATSKVYRGHATDIAKVRWAAGDAHLVSAGDRCVLQWAHVVDDVASLEEGRTTTLAPPTSDDTSSEAKAEAAVKIEAAMDDDDAESEDEDVGNAQKKAMQWLVAATPPTNNKATSNLNAPDVTVRLDWVHGCQTQDGKEDVMRSSIAYDARGDVVYPISKLGVIYSPRDHKQRYYHGHAAEVSALAVGPDGRFVASGEAALRPLVHVWDARSGRSASLLGPVHRRRISVLAFCLEGRRLVSIGADDDASLALYRSLSGEWHDAEILFLVSSGDRPCLFACFSSSVSGSSTEEMFDLATGGDGRMYFWGVTGATAVPTEGVWGPAAERQMLLCGAAVGDRVATGTSTGAILVWRGRTCEKSIAAHEGSVESIHASGNDDDISGGFVTGASDGFIKLWSLRFRHLKTYDLAEAPVRPLSSRIVAVRCGVDAATGKIVRILVGCASSEVLEIARESSSMTLFLEGHTRDDVWVVRAHPTDPDVFATAGDDGTVRVWSLSLHRVLRKAIFDGPIRCLAWAPQGDRILVGMGGTTTGTRHPKDGVFLLLDARTLRVLHEGRDSRHWLRCAAVSPDGTKFALGSMDHKIYIYDAKSTELTAKCTKHASYVTHLDFSQDSKFLQSDSADTDHLFHDTDGVHVRLPSQLRDTQFPNWTCIYGWYDFFKIFFLTLFFSQARPRLLGRSFRRRRPGSSKQCDDDGTKSGRIPPRRRRRCWRSPVLPVPQPSKSPRPCL